MVLRRRFAEVKPRAVLARKLKISAAYACQIAKGARIGSTETLARISAELGLTDAEIGASVREEFPAAFEGRDVAGPDHESDRAPAPAHTPAEGA